MRVMLIKTAVNVLGVRTEADYLFRFRDLLIRKGLVERGVPKEVEARVDAGRWIIDCQCNAGVMTHPDWKVAYCFECGRSYRVRFPSNVIEIETQLMGKSEGDAFWSPDPKPNIKPIDNFREFETEVDVALHGEESVTNGVS